jgi:NitT/TauT family transport system substrate-binding protein
MRHISHFSCAAFALACCVLAASPLFAQQGTPQKFKFRLDWKGGGQHALFYLGKQQGFYMDEGVDLEMYSGTGTSDSVKQVGIGAVDCALADALVVVQAAEQRVPIKSIAAYYQTNPIVLMSPKEKPITEPRQLLSGIKLGTKKGSATYQGLIALLTANNIRLEDIKLVDIGFGVAPLLVGQVDAMMGFATSEPVQAESKGMPIHLMPISDYGVDTYGLTMICNSTSMERNPALMRAFLKATQRAMQATIKDPAAGIAAVARDVEAVDVVLEAKTLARAISFWSNSETDAHGLGWQTLERWQRTIDVTRKLGLIEKPLRAEQLFTNAFFDSAAGAK